MTQAVSEATGSKKLLRPSCLPKLAECPCYQSTPIAGEAAERGTRMDNGFRYLMQGQPEHLAIGNLKKDEQDAVKWAVDTIRLICGTAKVVTAKEACKFPQWHREVSGGEADAICPELGLLFDLKSGQIRNYWEQQACYARSIMEQEFLNELTCYLIFCDQREVVKRTFTYEEASALVDGVVAEIRNDAEPRVCEYCSWCAKCDTCPTRNALATQALNVAAEPDVANIVERICANNDTLAAFLTGAKIVEEVREKVTLIAMERLNTGADVPGWKLVSAKGRATVKAESMAKYLPYLGARNFLPLCGSVPEKKLRELWEKEMKEPFPEELVQTGAGYSYLKKVTPKKPSTKKTK